MSEIASLLAIPAVRGWYLAICFAVMILPMVGLALWYHRNIGATPGGRALMDRQRQSHHPVRRGIWGATKNLAEAFRMGRDIEHGTYGDDAKRMQMIVYWVVGLWLVASVVCFGVLIWADEVNKQVPGT